MQPKVLRTTLAASALLLAASVPLASAEEAATATGDLWEVTSQMSMEGVPIPIPAQKVKVCSPREWKEPPGGADERRKCINSEFRVDGQKATWKVTCAGPPAMTGVGEIIREDASSWSGAIRFTSDEGAMTIKLGGRRLGDCESKS